MMMIIGLIDNRDKEENCLIDNLLRRSNNYFIDNEIQFRSQSVPIVVLDYHLIRMYQQIEKASLDDPQSIYVYKDGLYIKYQGNLVLTEFLYFLYKMLASPYIQLSKDSEIIRFISSGQNYQIDQFQEKEFLKNQMSQNDHNFSFKAIMVVFDKTQIPNIMNLWIEASLNLASRTDIRLGYIGDRARAQFFINQNKEKYFLGESKNFVLLINYQFDEPASIVLQLNKNMNIDIAEWININSIDSVYEIKRFSDAKIIDMIEAPKLALFIDETQQSRFILNHLHKIASQYKQKLCFIYFKDKQLWEVRHEFGIYGSDHPSLGIFTNLGVLYHFRYPLVTIENLEQYLKQFTTGQLRPLFNEQFRESFDYQILQLLKNTKSFNQQTFQEEVLDDISKDSLIYFYSSLKDSFQLKQSLEYASAVDTTAQRFKDHGFKNVIVGSYDIYRNGVPNIMTGIEYPKLILFPANQKESIIMYQEKDHKTRAYMEFVEKYGRSGIILQEKSHLPQRIVKVSEVQQEEQYHDQNLDEL